MGVISDIVGHATQQKAFELAKAAAAHDDEIVSLFHGLVWLL